MKKILSAVAMLFVVGALAVAGAGSASAHSTMVGGVAECHPDGSVSVTWTVSNDYQLPVRVTEASSTGGGTLSGLPVTIDAVSSSGTTTATVQQDGITSGTPTATLGVHGVWTDGYATDGSATVTLPQDCRPATTQVTPVEPSVVQSPACDVPGTLTVPSTEGVEYSLDGTPIAAGDHSGPLSGTVTAKAEQGYELTGTTSWPVSIAAAADCAQLVTPVAPTVLQSAACDTEGTLTVPSTEGVEYFLDGTPITAGDHSGPLSGTITAKAEQGFELTGTATWAVQISAAAVCQSGGGETGGGGDTSGGTTPGTTPGATTPPASPASPVPAGVSTPAASELAYTGISPQTWTYGVGGGLALLLLGATLSLSAARLRR